jgi:LysM repeat protein
MGEVRQINGTGGNTMKNTARTLGITAALAVMIPLTAYAATTTGNSSPATEKTNPSAWSAKGVSFEDPGGIGHKENIVSQEVLNLLKLDKAAFNVKIKAGSTLAKIAEEQGVSRDSLKSAMTAAFNKKQEEQKQDFTTNLDKIIDSDLQANKLKGRDGGLRVGLDFTEVAKVLGLSADQLKEQLSADKSLADLAKEKGVDFQKLIDAQIAALTSSINQAVKDGKLTQAQADKQLADVANFAEKIVNGLSKGHHQGGGKGRGFDGELPSEAEPVTPPTSS